MKVLLKLVSKKPCLVVFWGYLNRRRLALIRPWLNYLKKGTSKPSVKCQEPCQNWATLVSRCYLLILNCCNWFSRYWIIVGPYCRTECCFFMKTGGNCIGMVLERFWYLGLLLLPQILRPNHGLVGGTKIVTISKTTWWNGHYQIKINRSDKKDK